MALLAVLLLAGAAAAAWWFELFPIDVPGAERDDAAEVVGPDAAAGTIALVVTDPRDDDRAVRVAVLGYDPEAGEASSLLVPVGTVADLPGFGSFPLAEASRLQGESLVAVGLTNLLGVRLDAVVVLTPAELAARLGDERQIRVEVSSPVTLDAGLGGWEYPAGPQVHDADAFVTYLAAWAEGEGELDSLGRFGRALDGLLIALDDDPSAVEPLLDGARRSPADVGASPGVSDDAAATVLRTIASAVRDDRVATLTLPVTPIGSGEDAAFRAEVARVDDLVDGRFPAARPGGPGVGVRLQLLNGNGVPNVGLPVAERLVDGGYRVVLSDNADRFTYETTRIVVYDETADIVAAAEDIRDRLGVGSIERSSTPQSVVDVTIVIGADLREP
ncbi:MAG: LytR C-terminal domain-containing protein [Nitriliruptoraceae bacterium]|nr:LytR C-terminal domain-containing protein [Nitriliruptoraceae bacterium]